MAEFKLKVCLSEEIPDVSDMDLSYMYFAYDSLDLYVGQSLYTDNFSIAESMPDNPVPDMIYILLDGTVRSYIDFDVKTLGTIEDASEINLLRKAGTMYFVNAKHRYLDKQNRTLVLPYQNGSYTLSVSLPNDIVIDNNTVIKYDTEEEKFRIAGDSETYGNFTDSFTGYDGPSIKTSVDDFRISADAKISQDKTNSITLEKDGIYLNASKLVSIKQFKSWEATMQMFKEYIKNTLDDIDAEIGRITGQQIDDFVKREVDQVLRKSYQDVLEAINNYETLVQRVETDEENLKQYSDDSIRDAERDIQLYYDRKVSDAVESTTTYLMNQIEKLKELEQEQIAAIVTGVMMKVLESEDRELTEDEVSAIIASIIEQINKGE